MGQIGEFKALRSAFDHSLEQEIGIWIGIWETFFFYLWTDRPQLQNRV